MLPQDDMDCNKTCTVNVSLLVRMAHADTKRSGAKERARMRTPSWSQVGMRTCRPVIFWERVAQGSKREVMSRTFNSPSLMVLIDLLAKVQLNSIHLVFSPFILPLKTSISGAAMCLKETVGLSGYPASNFICSSSLCWIFSYLASSLRSKCLPH